MYITRATIGCSLYAGAGDLLERLQEHGVKVGLVTSKSRPHVWLLTTGIIAGRRCLCRPYATSRTRIPSLLSPAVGVTPDRPVMWTALRLKRAAGVKAVGGVRRVRQGFLEGTADQMVASIGSWPVLGV